MVDPIPPKFKKIWDDWNIRGVMLFSLSMQTFLILFAPFRKGTANKLIIILLWSVYLLADWAANFAVGLISDSQGKAPDSSTPSSENSDLLAFWPPFLLLHLGGPDTITAFALEDNELWLRHLLGLIFQTVAAVYVFLLSLHKNRLAIPTILMFFAGTIKYLERTRALYLASLDRFRDSMLKEPDPGPNYAKLIDEYSSKIAARLPAKIITIQEPEKEYKAGDDNDPERNKRKLNDLEVVQKAHYYFKIFKGLIVDLIFSFHERDESRDFFQKLSSEDALRVIEVELNFIYEVFYTKIQVVHSIIGYIMRFTSFGLVVAAFSLFCFRVKKHNYDELDVRITYILFWGAIGLDTVAFFMLVFSDWTFAALSLDNESKSRKMIKSSIASLLSWFLIFKKPRWYVCQKHSVEPKHEVLATRFLFRRWSGSVSGHNLVRYCLKARPTRYHYKVSHFLHINKVTGFIGLIGSNIIQFLGFIRGKFVRCLVLSCGRIPILGLIGGGIIRLLGFIRDKIVYYLCFDSMGGLPDYVDEMRYVSHEPLTKELWEFIFKELKGKSEILAQSKDPEAAKKICSARGDGILRDKDLRDRLLPYLTDVAYDESLLLWHIATELLYHTDGEEEGVTSNYREFSKLLSDYMLYLLVMQPSMMSAVAGIGKIRFRDTCAEANRFFKIKGLKGNQEGEACNEIGKVNTYVKPLTVKGDRSKSVLFDGSMLAKEMRKVNGKWEVLSKIWVEMVSYAACNCSAITHAQQVSKGGELITFVWLLMAHFGIGDQFQINKGQGRAKLIVTK